MITGLQVKQARKLLGWSAATLARKARKTVLTVSRFEEGTLRPRLCDKVQQAIQQALEDAGAEFTAENGGAGVRLKEGSRTDVQRSGSSQSPG